MVRSGSVACGLKPHPELCGKSMGNIANRSFRTKRIRWGRSYWLQRIAIVLFFWSERSRTININDKAIARRTGRVRGMRTINSLGTTGRWPVVAGSPVGNTLRAC
jgi:hypothetical protein